MSTSKQMYYFRYAGLTDTGMLRDHNEDAYRLPMVDATTLVEKGHLYVLADGMGGHQKGEVASAVTIEAINKEYYKNISSLESEDARESIIDALSYAIEQANHQVMVATEGGGTTVVAAVLYEDILVMMNVGDSRAYLLRDDELHPISRDHSLVSRLVEMGKITEEEALTHPRRNVLYQALGQGSDLEIYVFTSTIKIGDTLILCSDGLWGEIGDVAIQEVIEASDSPLTAIEEMIKRANESGGPDNITAIIIQVSDTKPLDSENIGIASYPAQVEELDDDTQPSHHPKPTTLPEGKYHTDENQATS